jgi:hypothetical protein
MEFSNKDLIQLEKKNIPLSTVLYQISNFENGFPFIKALRPAAINDGLLKLSEAEVDEKEAFFEAKAKKKKLYKFVPASGAASRMFKSLFAAMEEGKEDKSVDEFFTKLGEFAFSPKLSNSKDKTLILESLLKADGLNYGNMPKGLLDFHTYTDGVRTAVEEHLVEGAHYAQSGSKVRLHFTVSPEHKSKFKQLLSEVKTKYEQVYGVKYQIQFSIQEPATDTIAVDENNQPFRDAKGSILFRPAGHGALLHNLNLIDADIIFIKNIDNVVPDHLKTETVRYKKALAGVLLAYQQQIFGFMRRLKSDKPSPTTVRKALKFIKEQLCLEAPKGQRTWSFEEKLTYALNKLGRPLRVCGMVKNIGEPGGGPFWVKNEDGSVQLQVVESAQFDMGNAKQKEIFSSASHFNPVDLICATKDYKKQAYNLHEFKDPNTGFITEKSQAGRLLKAQELPGLWNGSMANWNTVFVEVPLITFNPVKTVNDLLRKEHQPA